MMRMMIMMMMVTMMMMMVLLFLFHLSASFPLIGWASEPGDNTDNTVSTINTISTINTANTISTISTMRLGNSQGKHNDTHTSSDVPTVSVIVGVSAFITFFLLNFMLWKRPEIQAGGVLGSLIHYPAGSLGNRTYQKPPEIPC
ncbi:uncharacterized protein Hap1MRO34_000560 isoform 1-T2 [Clarias gariepinus]